MTVAGSIQLVVGCQVDHKTLRDANDEEIKATQHQQLLYRMARIDNLAQRKIDKENFAGA